ncbi:MAG: PPC domain-containing protein [Treponema sp.]|jgi:hypothetical protein|nr:PPC domain-containing protein [Treponema sp.]
MVKRLTPLILAVLLCPVLSAQHQNLADLDAETAKIVLQIQNALGNQEKTIEGSVFTLDGFEPPLGNYWKLNILDGITKRQGKLKVITTANQSNFILVGEIVSLGETARVYTRVVDRAAAVVLYSWTSDLAKTDFVAGLLVSTGGGDTDSARDAWEDDSRERPLSVAVPSITRRTLTRGDQDWFLISSPEGELITAETTSDLDTMMELYAKGESRRLSSNDDNGGSENARISFTAEAGKEYILMVKGYSNSDIGRYEFHVSSTELSDRDREPNETLETASALILPLDGGVNAIITGRDDTDWYSINLENGGMFSAWTTGNLDTVLDLYGADGALIVSDDDSGERDNAKISRSIGAGRYYIRVKSYGGGTGAYNLFAGITGLVSDAYENDNQRGAAKELPLDQGQEHTFTGGDDVDWVYFTVVAAGPYHISCRGVRNTGLDTFIGLYDGEGSQIDEDDDGGEGYGSALTRRLEPGKYYVRIHCLDAADGNNYTIRVTGR